MRTRTPGRTALWGLALLLAGCGKESWQEKLAGTYATESVQADLEEHEEAFVSDGLFAKFDDVDRAEAAEAGKVWARLRLGTDGRFDYEGPAADDGPPKARLRGRWTGSRASVDLSVEKANGEGEDLPKQILCPVYGSQVEIPFLSDPSTRKPLRLSKR